MNIHTPNWRCHGLMLLYRNHYECIVSYDKYYWEQAVDLPTSQHQAAFVVLQTIGKNCQLKLFGF